MLTTTAYTPTTAELYARATQSWGGATVARDGSTVPEGIDAYAVSMARHPSDTLSIPADASYEQFTSAYDQSRARFAYAPFTGIFHDDAKGTIDFDPVAVVSGRGEVDSLAATYPIIGGAYNFATGDGYWPEHSAMHSVIGQN